MHPRPKENRSVDLAIELQRLRELLEITARQVDAGNVTRKDVKELFEEALAPILDAICGPPETHNEPPATLDPLLAWTLLPPNAQQQIGAAAVAVGVASLGAGIAREREDEDGHKSRAVAYHEALSLLYEAVTTHLLRGDDETMPPRPDLRALGVRQCLSCGCTNDFPCDGGCHWVAEDLCSTCVPATSNA